jgi:Zn-dependent protease
MDFSHVNVVEKLFQYIAFLFALSVHESAHAWMANRCGDPTARLLGRITLNPLAHIDPIGTVVMPLIGMFSGFPVIGWAKPTPVDPKNLKNPVRDDILTAVVGPISNFFLAVCTVVVMFFIAKSSASGNFLVKNIASYGPGFANLAGSSFLVPVTLFFYEAMLINVVLGVFNLIPVSPLDGSHVLRHFLPDPVRRIYDAAGIFGLLALVYLGGNLLSRVISPFLVFFDSILTRF